MFETSKVVDPMDAEDGINMARAFIIALITCLVRVAVTVCVCLGFVHVYLKKKGFKGRFGFSKGQEDIPETIETPAKQGSTDSSSFH